MNPRRLVLIDGNSLLHRAYHALPKTLTSADGTPVNAVYGFARMLLKVVKDLRPAYLAVAFDRPEPTFRHREYVGYKAKRPPMEDDLVPQVELTHRLVAGLGIPIYEAAGFEADDVIGTLASQAGESAKPHLETVIVSGDRDVFQLINARVKAYTPMKGLSDPEVFDTKKVGEKCGLSPAQLTDFKGLRGDPSDNIPGVKGIGEKTAVELLRRFGSLEGIYKHLGEIDPKVVTKLTEQAEQAALSKKLAKIVRDVPIELDIGGCQFGFDKERAEKAKKVFWGLGFKSLAKELDKELEKEAGERSDPQLSLI